jgi:inorganic pyrophosphatase
MSEPANWAALDLWQHADLLVASGEIRIDRPAGSAHPKVPEFVYPVDYGYIEGTVGGDGHGVDVWVGTAPPTGVTALACTVDPYKKNAELKLFLNCTDDEIARIEVFYTPQPQAAMVLRRPT